MVGAAVVVVGAAVVVVAGVLVVVRGRRASSWLVVVGPPARRSTVTPLDVLFDRVSFVAQSIDCS